MREVPREPSCPRPCGSSPTRTRRCRSRKARPSRSPISSRCMIEAAEVEPGDRVLEIGAGSGYAAAVLGELAAEVFTIERHPALAELARARLRSSATTMSRCARRRHARLARGRRRSTPSSPPPAARTCPAWRASSRSAAGWSCRSARRRRISAWSSSRAPARTISSEEELGEVRFVPLIGEQGWPEEHATCRDEPRREPRPTSGLHQLIRAAGRAAARPRRSRLRRAPFDRFADAASCCWARPATARPNSTAPAPPSRGG